MVSGIGYQQNSSLMGKAVKAGTVGAGAYGAYKLAKSPIGQRSLDYIKAEGLNKTTLTNIANDFKGNTSLSGAVSKITNSSVNKTLSGVFAKGATKSGILGKVAGWFAKGPTVLKVAGAAIGALALGKAVLGGKKEEAQIQPNPFATQDPMMANLGINPNLGM